jgi:NADPH-dependent glutamate synthase beta subunit-like oxidoreductase
VSAGKELRLKDRILVVGGGNVAVDVALTALRTGGKQVTMACLESREEMPASAWEIAQVMEEGVNLMPSWGPNRIIHENGNVKAIELVTCTCVFDEKGNFCPAFGEDRKSVEADQVILAIGQSAELSFLASCGNVKSERGLIAIDPKTHETGVPGVFAGGDATRGPGAIIDAIAAGRRAAGAIDRFLGGDGVIEESLSQKPENASYDGKREKGFADLFRESAPHLPLEERRDNFREVDRCLSDEQAVSEAKRCLQCDLEIKLAKAMRP